MKKVLESKVKKRVTKSKFEMIVTSYVNNKNLDDEKKTAVRIQKTRSAGPSKTKPLLQPRSPFVNCEAVHCKYK